MIGRANRFHGRASIVRLRARSRTVRQAALSLRFALSKPGKPTRVAVVVSRKVSKSAVVRNRIRRRVYEQVRILFSSLQEPADLLITVYDERIAEMPVQQLESELQKLLHKARLTSATHVARGIMEPKE